MIIQGLLHVAAPGHTLFSVVALCLVGGHVIAVTCAGLSRGLAPGIAVVATAGAIALNILLFFGRVTLNFSPPAFSGQFGNVVTRAFLMAANQVSLRDLRSMNELAESSVEEVRRLTKSDRPVIVVSTEGSARYFRFLQARIASYYLSDRDFWIVVDGQDPPRASRIRGKDLLEIRHGKTVRIPVPRGGRIIWLVDPSSPFRTAISRVISLKQDKNVFHTDLASDLPDFRIDDFEFKIQD
jgi:hypothetical protein